MPRPDKQAHEFVKLQHTIASLLAAMYLQQQQQMAEQTAHGWRPHTVNLGKPTDGKSVPILNASARRFNARIFVDPAENMIGGSDLLICDTEFDVPSILAQYNGTVGAQINAFIIRAGQNLQVDSQGPIYAAPLATDGTLALVRIVETVFELDVKGVAARQGMGARNDGHKWNGLSDSIPGIITSLV
jgi:hypothetical protein